MGSSNSKNTGTRRPPPRKPAKGQTGSGKKRSKEVNETTFNKRIRDHLREATTKDNIADLQNQMEAFERNNLEDAGDYTAAKDRLEFLKLRKDIKDACLRRNVQVLNDSIKKVQGSKYKNRLKPFLDRANFIRNQLGNSTSFKHEIPGLNQITISEIRSYNRPPIGVHETMIAVYLINGYHEDRLTDWAELTGLMGRTGDHYLLREISLAEGKKPDKETATKASAYLATHSLEVVRQTSNGAAAFYVWASQKVGGVKKGKTTDLNKSLTNTGGRGPQFHQTAMQPIQNDTAGTGKGRQKSANAQPKTPQKNDTKNARQTVGKARTSKTK